MQAFFILGNQRAIAREEVEVVVGGGKVLVDVDETVILEDVQANTGALLVRLGSVIKVGAIHAYAEDRGALIDVLEGLVHTLRPGDSKVRIGLSVYHGGHRGTLVAMKTGLEKLGMQVKRRIGDARSVRMVTSRVPVLSSVIVKKQRLLEDGIEFCLFPTKDGVYIGVTEAVQDFEDWSRRDYGRPERHAKRGMLPPKLARTMLNLAGGNPETDTVLDPFCGVGTVLSEALALGYRRLVASDIDEKATDATRTNLEWEAKDMGIEIEPTIIQSQAEMLHSFLAPDSVDVVASEFYLGQPRTGEESKEELEQRLKALTELYTESFRGISTVLKPGAHAVFAIPAYVHGGFVLVPGIVERAKLFGLHMLPYVSKEVTKEGALRYGRDGQYVLRDLYRFVYRPN